ncbi:MAG: VWA domain-containing protein [Verrucomicrobia bacterium]|nr:VWA domain-containing protein [Verrucomicrobiota bacterium]
MQFLFPQAWWLTLLGILPVALYFFKRRSRSVPVSTMVFFRWLAEQHQDSAWLRRLKRWISFILTMILFLGPVFLLARLSRTPFSGGVRNVVILLDRSASMGAVDAAGVTRFEAARQLIRSRIQALPEQVGVALVVYDSRPQVIEARGTQRRAFLAALDALQADPVAGDAAAALETARTLARLETPAEIWQVSDHPAPSGSVGPDKEVRFVPLSVALPVATNVGFTAFQVRKEPLQAGRYTAFVQISANRAAPRAVEGRITGRIGEAPLAPRGFRLEPGEVRGLELPLSGVKGQLLRLVLEVPGDALEVDNTLLAPLPESRPVVAVRVGRKEQVDPYAHLALQSLVEEGELKIWSVQPENWPVRDVDVAIFDNWLPEAWPTDLPAVVLNPPGSAGPVRARSLGTAGLPHREIQEVVPGHPVLFRVSGSRVALTQSCVVEPVGSLQPLWSAGGEPILLAGTVKGQRLVVMAFSPRQSERLPMTASFPLLMGNSIYWCAEGRRQEELMGSGNGRTGKLVEVSGGELRWTGLRAGELTRQVERLPAGVAELRRSGVWEDGSGRRGAAHLLSREESDLTAARTGAEAGSPPPGSGLVSGGMVCSLIGFLLVLLLLENVLFHRWALH